MRHVLIALMLAFLGAPALPQDQTELAAGLEAYEFFCSKCHGKDMVNSGVSSYDLRKFPLDQKDRFYSSVLEGKGDMPAWGDVIYPEEMDALWVYVATRGGTQPMVEKEEGASLELRPEDLVQAGHLTACLARNAGAISGRRSNGGIGIDFQLSAALADKLGLDLKTVWYESETGEESDPVTQTYAMLAYPLCDFVTSHPLYAPAVGDPPTQRAALPRWHGMPTETDAETGRRVDKKMPHILLRPISVTEPYMRAEIGLVYRAGDPEPTGLKNLGERRLAVQQGTLSGSIATMASVPHLVTFNPGAKFLWHLETGDADVAIADIAAFDGHRRHNNITDLRLADWRHSIGFDIGVAVLSSRSDLRAALDGAIKDLTASGAVSLMADAEGVTYKKPAEGDFLRPALSLRELVAPE